MADRTVTLEVTGVLDTATNWKDDTKAATGDVIVLNAALNAPNGYADGEVLTTAFTDDGTFGLSLAGGASLSLSAILGDLANQAISTVTVAGASTYTHNATETITGNVVLTDASTMIVSANAAITGTTTVGDGTFNNTSTGTFTGAVTIAAGGTYATYASNTVTGGITCTGGHLRITSGATLTSGVILAAASHLVMTGTGALIGAVTTTGNCEVSIDAGTSITGTFDADDDTVTWVCAGTGTLTVNNTSDLVLGGAATGLAVVIDANAKTVTAGAAISCKSLTLHDGTYVAAQTHTVADGQKLTVAGSATLTLTDAGLYVHVTSGTCTLGGALTCAGVYLDAGTTLNGAGNDVVITDSASTTVNARHRITGFGTVTNIDPVGDAIHLGPGITQGAGNTNVVADTYQDGGLDL